MSTDTMDLSALSPEDEVDLSQFKQIETFEGELLIVEAGIEDSEQGRRWFAVFEPVEPEYRETLPGGKVRDSGFLSHEEREDLPKYGIAGLKRLFKAAFGVDSGRVSDLEGQTIRAQVSEDDSGFARIRKMKAA